MKILFQKRAMFFFLLNIFFKKEKLNIFFVEKLAKNLEGLRSGNFFFFYLSIRRNFFLQLGLGLIFKNSVSEIKLKRGHFFSNFSIISFFPNFYFRKNSIFHSSKIEKQKIFGFFRKLQLIKLSEKIFPLEFGLNRFFFSKNFCLPLNISILKKKRGTKKESCHPKSENLIFPLFQKNFFSTFRINFSFFKFQKFCRNFGYKKTLFFFYSSFLIEILTEKNQVIPFFKKTFTNSYSIKKKNSQGRMTKELYLTCSKIFQGEFEMFRPSNKQKNETISFNLTNNLKNNTFQFFQTHLLFFIDRNSVQSLFFDLKTKKEFLGSRINFLKSLRKRRFWCVSNPLFFFFLSDISKKGLNLNFLDLELFLGSLLKEKLNQIWFSRKSNYLKLLIFRFFSFSGTFSFPLFTCLVYHNLSTILNLKKHINYQKIILCYTQFLPWTEISGKFHKEYSTKKNSKHGTKINFFCCCQKCKLNFFCLLFGNMLQKKKKILELKSIIIDSFENFPLKTSDVCMFRNFLISFINSNPKKIFREKGKPSKKNFLRILITCALKLIKKDLERKFSLKCLKENLKTKGGFFFLAFLLNSDFFFQIQSMKAIDSKYKNHSAKLEALLQKSPDKNISKFSQDSFKSKRSENFSKTLEKISPDNPGVIFYSSWAPNRDTFFLDEIVLTHQKEKKPLTNLNFFFFFLGNFSKINKNDFFRFLKLFSYREKSIEFDFQIFFINPILNLGIWKKKLSRTLFSLRKIFLKKSSAFPPHKIRFLVLVSLVWGSFLNFEKVFGLFSIILQRLKESIFIHEISSAFTYLFFFLKEKRNLFLIREGFKSSLAHTGILGFFKICFLEKNKLDLIAFFSRIFDHSFFDSEETLVILNRFLATFHFLHHFSKTNNSKLYFKPIMSSILKILSLKLGKKCYLKMENKKLKEMEKSPFTFFFFFSRDFFRNFNINLSVKKSKKPDFRRSYPFLDRSEIPFENFSQNPDRILRYLKYFTGCIPKNQ